MLSFTAFDEVMIEQKIHERSKRRNRLRHPELTAMIDFGGWNRAQGVVGVYNLAQINLGLGTLTDSDDTPKADFEMAILNGSLRPGSPFSVHHDQRRCRRPSTRHILSLHPQITHRGSGCIQTLETARSAL